MLSAEIPSLDEYVDITALVADVKQCGFTTEQSVLWYVRRNRDALVSAGAVIIIAGRMRFHPARFKQAAVEIGQRAALKQKNKSPAFFSVEAYVEKLQAEAGPIELDGLSTRAKGVLLIMDIRRKDQVITALLKRPLDIKHSPNCGKKTFAEICEWAGIAVV